MDYLYAPWRCEYISNKEKLDCVFCHISQNPSLDVEHRVLYRDEVCFAVMNKYPYTPGHFMIIPHFHTQNLEDLDEKSWLHITSLAQKGVKMLKEYNAQGVNLGMNLGDAGGAGISEHIHLHLVPRWQKDTNFITSIGNTRVFSTDFNKIYSDLVELSKEFFR